MKNFESLQAALNNKAEYWNFLISKSNYNVLLVDIEKFRIEKDRILKYFDYNSSVLCAVKNLNECAEFIQDTVGLINQIKNLQNN